MLLGCQWDALNGVAAGAPATARAPEKLTLSLVMIADTQPKEYLFVIGNSLGFKTVDSLQKYVAGLPAGSTLTWDPGCCRIGGEPLISSDTDMAAFKKFCAEHKVELVILPSG